MILLTTKKFSFALFVFVGVIINTHWVSSKSIHPNRGKDCFESCSHKLFEIFEKVYDSGNISLKCSPYYTFGECVEKCYNHHDTTVSLKFLKKCDDSVDHEYAKVSNHNKCLQQSFGKDRERCSLECAKKALGKTSDRKVVDKSSQGDSSLESSCSNLVCRLGCLENLMNKHCPKTSRNVMNALLAPFDIFGKMMKEFSSHHSFKKTLHSSECKGLFARDVTEKKHDSSSGVAHKMETSGGGVSNFVSVIKPTPPAPLLIVGEPHSEPHKESMDDLNEVYVSNELKDNEDYEEYHSDGGDVTQDESGGDELKYLLKNGRDKNIVYQAHFDFEEPSHELNVKPSHYRFTGPLSNECGSIMIIDDDEKITLCSTPTLYFVTTDENTIKNVFMNYGILEKYQSNSDLSEEIYEQYKNLIDRMKVGGSQISSIFGGGNVDKFNQDENLQPLDGFNSAGDSKEEFVTSTSDNMLDDVDSYEDNLEEHDQFEKKFEKDGDLKSRRNKGNAFSAGKVGSTISTQSSNNEDFDLFHQSSFRSIISEPSDENFHQESEPSVTVEFETSTEHSKVRSKQTDKSNRVNRGPSFHGQDNDFNDRFNNVLPDQEMLSYGVDGKLVPRSAATFRLRLPDLRDIVAKRTDDH